MNHKFLRTTLLVSFLSLFMVACQHTEPITATDSSYWQLAAPMTKARGDMLSHRLPNGHVVIVGYQYRSDMEGLKDYDKSSLEIYDPQNNEWFGYTRSPVDLIYSWGALTPTQNGQLALLSGCRFAFYDLKKTSWSKEYIFYTDMKQTKMPPYPNPCENSRAVLIADDAFLIFEQSSYNAGYVGFLSLENRVYRPAGQMSAPRNYVATVVLNEQGEVLVAGGSGGYGITYDLVEIYNPQKNEWRQVASLNVPRSTATALRLKDDKVILIGAHNYANPPVQIETLKNPHPLMKECPSPMLLSNTVEIYDPKTDQWTWAAPVSCNQDYKDRWLIHAIVLQDGRVMTIWADDDTPQIYDPVLDQWTNAPKLNAPRYIGGALIELPDGRVMFAGGQTKEDGPYLDIVEIFKP